MINQQKHQERIKAFLDWFKNCKGSEKGEGQIFFDRLFQAFGNTGVLGAGAVCEKPLKKREGKGVSFADLVWKPRVIIELKKRGTPLQKHYDQAFNYWITLVPDRPKYMVLCNFDEFWIYDLNSQLYDPVHKLNTKDLQTSWGALKFLLPIEEEPLFNNHNIAITEQVAKTVGKIYLSMVKRDIEKDKAQRFILQLVIALFSEDVGLIPQYTLHEILKKSIDDLKAQKELSFLFKAMAFKNKLDKPTKYKHIGYFNGGIFKETTAVELSYKEIKLLYDASKQNWEKVRPSIFGSLFEGSMDQEKRHGHGIHYTNELDIHKIVGPCIVLPFKEKISKARTKREKRKLLREIQEFKVLDPACGSGNFLYIAFRELRKLEMDILESLGEGGQIRPSELGLLVSPRSFYGIDTNKFGLELAKVALSIGRKLLADEFNIQDPSLPFDDLDDNFSSEDALFTEWPEADVIIGNPPFLSSKKMKRELPVEYVDKVRQKFKEVPGRADYCVYWFRKAHDNLKKGQRAGLVGTNTIRENYSRQGGLDYIVKNKGTITEAVSTQVWSGEANVHVSIVNWVKGSFQGKKKLFTQLGNKVASSWKIETPKKINSGLSSKTSVKAAHVLKANRKPKRCFQGQTTGTSNFYLSKEEYKSFINKNPKNAEVIFPFFTGREFLNAQGKKRLPKRFMIDFSQMNILEAKRYKEPFQHIQKTVLPDVKRKAADEIKKQGKPKDWNNHLKFWWRHWRNRPDLIRAVSKVKKYIVVSRTVKKPLAFEFISNAIRIADAVVAFDFEDNYSFGIIQSSVHLEWVKSCGGTLKGDIRYTGDTVFSTFPWPQNPTEIQIKKISTTVNNLMKIRKEAMSKNNWGLRELYNTLEDTGQNPLKEAHKQLDETVRQAYGMKKNEDILEFLLNLNTELHKREEQGLKVTGPGVPQIVKNPGELITEDCISI
ncbi:MAG: N-6 DNA methylase [Bdellovibrionales bacterium]|nr:N-6 DNA methylase [Bdellovibrionales bacterium]